MSRFGCFCDYSCNGEIAFAERGGNKERYKDTACNVQQARKATTWRGASCTSFLESSPYLCNSYGTLYTTTMGHSVCKGVQEVRKVSITASLHVFPTTAQYYVLYSQQTNGHVAPF